MTKMRGFRTTISAIAFAAAMAAGAAPAAAATVLNVNWNDSCGKASCFNENGVYTQRFSASDFQGPVTISRLLMQRGVLGALDGSTFRLSFSLNGAELGTWGHYNMAGINGEQLTFGGEEFVWNPEFGDLELILAITPPPKAGGGGFFLSSVAEGGGDPGPGGPENGGFVVETPGDDGSQGGPLGGRGPLGAVPEPGVWAMMIAGFGLAGASLRRRRAVADLQP